jgi:hypothetical protein
MPTLHDLQRGKSRNELQSSSAFYTHEDESIITDERCELSPAQCVEEKLLRLLQGTESLLNSSLVPRRPR